MQSRCSEDSGVVGQNCKMGLQIVLNKPWLSWEEGYATSLVWRWKILGLLSFPLVRSPVFLRDQEPSRAVLC